ncbi:hypothetical protein [Streptomyces sp. WZ-12]|uniref:hypothetical protein n=1 Tax=Streptomyces sp. WZ-12 TaxID=3030210 RepID=UPI002380FD86|nr:hypothetical protein [Streptomyces sp. WZ-12]
MKQVDSSYRWRQMNLPVHAWGERLSDLPEPAPPEQLKEFARQFHVRYIPKTASLADFPKQRYLIGRGVMLTGAPGRGKTRAACATLVSVCTHYQLAGYFVRFSDYIQAKTSHFATSSKLDKGFGGEDAIWEVERFKSMENTLYTVPLLVLDDVGKEHQTSSGFAQQQFATLLRSRFDNALPTIVTTNLNGKQWEATYEVSESSFAQQAFDIVPMAGKDLRAAR